MENTRGRGFMDRSCCDRPRFPAAIRALDDRDGERESERQRETGGRAEESEGKEKSQSGPSITIRYWLDFGPVRWCVFAITPDK